MTAWTGAALAQLQSGSFTRRWAFRFVVRPIGGGATTNFNIWEGEQDQDFTLDGTSRTYQGVGDAIQMDRIPYTQGTQINYLGLRLPLTAEGETLVRGWDTRQAQAWVYCLIFDPLTDAFLGSRRYWKGFIDDVAISTGQQNGASMAAVTLASTARLGTLNPAGKKSDESQKKRFAGDRFRRFGDLGTKPNDPWGGQRD